MSKVNTAPPPAMIGGDPEFFLIDTKKNPVASCGIIGGYKGIPVPSLCGSGGWLEDNVAIELNPKPARDAHTFLYNTNNLMRELSVKLKELHLLPSVVPYMNFDAVQLSHPKAGVFGCEPDFCAYDNPGGPLVPRALSVESMGNTRYGGGHVHLSYTSKDVPPYAVIMLLDAFAGLPSLLWDRQGERRSKYGRAGLYRIKKYSDGAQGVEWRTPSNWWINTRSTPYLYRRSPWLSLIHQVGGAVQGCPDELATLFTRLPIMDIKNCIDKEDHSRAKELWEYVVQQNNNSRVSDWIGIPTGDLTIPDADIIRYANESPDGRVSNRLKAYKKAVYHPLTLSP